MTQSPEDSLLAQLGSGISDTVQIEARVQSSVVRRNQSRDTVDCGRSRSHCSSHWPPASCPDTPRTLRDRIRPRSGNCKSTVDYGRMTIDFSYIHAVTNRTLGYDRYTDQSTVTYSSIGTNLGRGSLVHSMPHEHT